MKILNAYLHELRIFCSGFGILFWKYVKSARKEITQTAPRAHYTQYMILQTHDLNLTFIGKGDFINRGKNMPPWNCHLLKLTTYSVISPEAKQVYGRTVNGILQQGCTSISISFKSATNFISIYFRS